MGKLRPPSHASNLQDALTDLVKTGATRDQIHALVLAVRPIYGSCGPTWPQYESMLNRLFPETKQE